MLSFIEQQANMLMSDRTASGEYQIERKKNPSVFLLVRMSSARKDSKLGTLYVLPDVLFQSIAHQYHITGRYLPTFF